MCISSSAEPEPHKMNRAEEELDWIHEKYGQPLKPWFSPLIKVDATEVKIEEPIRYQYLLVNKQL